MLSKAAPSHHSQGLARGQPEGSRRAWDTSRRSAPFLTQGILVGVAGGSQGLHGCWASAAALWTAACRPRPATEDKGCIAPT